MRRIVVALAAAVALSAAAARSPGSSAGPPVADASATRYASAVEQVVVDVIVFDEDGSAVSGLAREDFQVEEEGIDQAIVAFEPVVSGAFPTSRSSTEPGAQAAGQPATPGPAAAVEPSRDDARRTFALVFDDLSLTRQQGERGVAALRQLVAAGASGSDLVVLATSSGAAGWTGRTEAERQDLLAVLARQSGRRVVEVGAERVADAEAYRIHVEDDERTIGQVVSRYYQENVVPPNTPAQAVKALVRAEAAAAYDRAVRRVEPVLSALERAANGLEAARGRKAIVLVSPGFFYAPASPRYQRVLDACRRANAAIYFLDLAGIEALPTGLTARYKTPFSEAYGKQVDPAATMSALYAGSRDENAGAVVLANDSGGVVATDLALGLRRVVEDTRAYYLLGYVPGNPARDGRYRRISVRLAPSSSAAGRGLHVRARRGYYAPGPAAPGRGPDPEAELWSALASPTERSEVPVRLSAYVMEDSPVTPGRVRCAVVLETDPAGLSLREERGRTLGALDAAFAAQPRDAGARVEPVRKHAQLKVAAATLGELRRRWYALAHELELEPGVHQLRAAVRDAASGRTGSATLRLDVPRPGTFRVSTPFVSDVFDSDPQGYPHPRPTGRREFPVGGPVYLAFDVHGATTDPATGTPAVAMGYRVEDSEGRVALEVEPRPIALAPGSARRLFAGTGFDAGETRPPQTAPGPSSAPAPVAAPAPHRFLGFELGRAEPGEYRVVAQVVDTVGRREITFVEPFRVVAPPEPLADASSGERGPASSTPPDPALEALLRLAGAYVVEYERAFGAVVLEEEYRQRGPRAADGLDWRRTRADLVFARLPGVVPWWSFRDVFELNGQPVRDRDRRLEALFAQDAVAAVERARAIVTESARYNIGPERTINMPAMPLLFLHPDNQPRFRFERRGRPEGGTVEIAFRETGRPTLVRDRPPARTAERGRDLPAEGRFWLDARRGTVVRSEVRFRWRPWPDLATITTVYRAEPRLAMWLPAEMRERYEGEELLGGTTEAVATYSNYRRFGVSVREDPVRLPPSP